MKDANGKVFRFGDYISGANRFFVYVVTSVEHKRMCIKAVVSGKTYTIQKNDGAFTILEPEELI